MSALDFIALDARARGLKAHLLGRAELERIAQTPQLPALVRELNRALFAAPLPETASADELELAVRRAVFGRLRTLSRWAPASPALLEVLYAEEERRSLRALLRGAVQGAPAARRLEGLLATPRLPARALEELARLATPRDVARRLARWAHPDAAALLPFTAAAHPDPLELERVLLRGQATRLRAVAASGDANVRALVQAQLDLGNAQTALLLAGARPPEPDAASFFVEGGRSVSRDAFTAAASAETREAAARILARASTGTPLASLLAEGHADAAELERRGLVLALEHQRRQARLAPLGSAPLLAYLLGLRANLVDLSRLTWGAALSTGARQLRSSLVTPWS